MTTSNSIDYSIINEQNIRLTTDLELVDQNNQNQEKSLKESSQILEENTKEKDKSDTNIFQKDLSKENNKSKSISVHNLLYGNPIDCLTPKFLGKSYAFFYDEKGDPKITIGPDCK